MTMTLLLSTTSVLTTCCSLDFSVPLSSAFCRMRCTASMTSHSCARNALPRSVVHCTSSARRLTTSGKRPSPGRSDPTAAARRHQRAPVLQAWILREPLLQLNDLQRVRRGRERLRQQRVGIERDRRDQRIELIRREASRLTATDCRRLSAQQVARRDLGERATRNRQQRAEHRDETAHAWARTIVYRFHAGARCKHVTAPRARVECAHDPRALSRDVVSASHVAVTAAPTGRARDGPHVAHQSSVYGKELTMTTRHVRSVLVASTLTFGMVALVPVTGHGQNSTPIPEKGGSITMVGCFTRGQIGSHEKFVLAKPTVGSVASVPEATCTASGTDELIKLQDLSQVHLGDAMLGRWIEIHGRLEGDHRADAIREVHVKSVLARAGRRAAATTGRGGGDTAGAADDRRGGTGDAGSGAAGRRAASRNGRCSHRAAEDRDVGAALRADRLRVARRGARVSPVQSAS